MELSGWFTIERTAGKTDFEQLAISTGKSDSGNAEPKSKLLLAECTKTLSFQGKHTQTAIRFRIAQFRSTRPPHCRCVIRRAVREQYTSTYHMESN